MLAPYGTAHTLQDIPLQTRGSADLKSNPTLASGDVQIDIDGGGWANIEGAGVFADFVDVYPAASTSVRLRLTAAQLEAKVASVRFIDQTAAKEWEDRLIVLETYGHASAQHPVFPADVVNWKGSAAPAMTGDAFARIGADGAGLTSVALSAAGILAIWDALTSALTTVGSIGKLLVDRIDAAISSLSTLTAQGVADALKLAPAAGDPAAGSVNKHLDDILEDTGTTLPATLAGIVASIAALPADVWANPTRALTAIIAELQSLISGTLITLYTHEARTITLSGIGDLGGFDRIIWCIKANRDQADADSLLFTDDDTGLTVLAGAAPAAGETCELVYSALGTGSVVITPSAAAAAKLPPGEGYIAALKVIDGADTRTIEERTVNVVQGVIRATS